MASQVLVVTDDDYVREEVSYGFPDDVEITLAEDAQDALIHLRDHVPDAVIVALRTGNSGGFALARDMSQRLALRDVPLFMLLEREQDAWLARQAGATIYRAEPLDPGALVAETMGLLHRTVPA